MKRRRFLIIILCVPFCFGKNLHNVVCLSLSPCSGKKKIHSLRYSHHSRTPRTFYCGHRQDQIFSVPRVETMSHINWEADKMYKHSHALNFQHCFAFVSTISFSFYLFSSFLSWYCVSLFCVLFSCFCGGAVPAFVT